MPTSTATTPDYDTKTDDFTITGTPGDLTVTFHDETSDLTVRIDVASIVESTDLIDVEDADDHCAHDTDDFYNEGYAAATERHDSATAEVMRRWHDDNHAGVVQFCYEQPCADLRKAVSG